MNIAIFPLIFLYLCIPPLSGHPELHAGRRERGPNGLLEDIHAARGQARSLRSGPELDMYGMWSRRDQVQSVVDKPYLHGLELSGSDGADQSPHTLRREQPPNSELGELK